MKIIITGPTGFVGSEVVRQAIADDRIDHAFVLTRRPLPADLIDCDKITVIQHQDFSSYPEELLQQLEGAEGCIWAIGGRAPQFPDVETARKVSVDYTLAAAQAFRAHLAPRLPAGRKFRFLFCSGKFAEWDDKKRLSFMNDTRRIKGAVEKGLCDLADTNKDLDVVIVRPGGILAKDAGPLKAAPLKLVGFIPVERLAKAMVRLVVEGHESRIVEAEVLTKM
ncbi:hypothetical protein F4780DRAFT_447686 [Xylariomycetidae sp. FL0641]|nr:hypothetical protein F4780DRAFT_447686 [Xylariomycetidae sp. FL0641]